MRGEVFPDGTTVIVPEYLTGCYPAVKWGEGSRDRLPDGQPGGLPGCPDDGEPVRDMFCGVHEVAWTFDGCPVMT